jgi:uncharacterized cupredoxin-like copper-binding protein
MTAYYVLGIAMVVLAVVLSAIGLTRENFPPSLGVARGIMLGTLVLVLTGAGVLIATSEKEHPRAEAAEKAAEKKAEEEDAKGGEPAPEKAGETVRATEKEFSIALQPDSLKAGRYTFDVVNEGKIQHDLEIEGGGVEEKTPLIDPGKTAQLPAELKPGKYRFYCTVPGHAQSGMDVDVSVR